MRSTAITLFVLTACATKHPGSYEVAQAVATTDGGQARTEADALWEQRSDKARLSEALVKYEAAYNANPSDRDVAARLTRGYYFLGDAYETEKEGKLAQWDKAITWGKRCMAINQEFTALLAKGDETEATAIRAAAVADVPCVYWTATALGKWAKLSGLATTLKHLGTVKAYITRVSELDPSYFFHGPDRYWGAYYAAIPSFAGKDLDKSKSHFEKAIAGSPDYVGTKVLYAEFWAVGQQDKQAFEKTLNEVIAADENAIPEIKPEVLAEKQKAQALLSKESELFAD
jgi:tetratricopeptide (TPR) repeat protein